MMFKHAHAGVCAVCGKYKKVISDDDNLCFTCFRKKESTLGYPSLKKMFKKEKKEYE